MGHNVWEDLEALADAYDQATYPMRLQVENEARALWRAMGRDRRDKDIEAFVQDLLPQVLAGQMEMTHLTHGYLAACAEILGVEAPSLLAVDSQWLEDGVRGVPPELVYTRPGHTVHRALAEGKPFDEAVDAGELRLLQIVGGDLQLARTGSAHRGMQSWSQEARGVQFYRRILTGRENCALCVVASTQHYRVDKVMPIHPGCDCGFAPIPPGMGLDRVIDPEVLEAAHQVVQARTGESTRSATGYAKHILTREHDEYGPVLSWRGSLHELHAEKRAQN